jgi:hypothetical protein
MVLVALVEIIMFMERQVLLVQVVLECLMVVVEEVMEITSLQDLLVVEMEP